MKTHTTLHIAAALIASLTLMASACDDSVTYSGAEEIEDRPDTGEPDSDPSPDPNPTPPPQPEPPPTPDPVPNDNCADLGREACVDAIPNCRPLCGGLCDCDCPEATCGCEGCPSDCFVFEACEPCPPPDDPRVGYIGNSPRECALIDFGCPDAWEGFDSLCGCGCRADIACEPSKFRTSGIVEGFSLDDQCDFLVLCASETIEGSLITAISDAFPQFNCGGEPDFTCGPDAVASCIIPIGRLNGEQVEAMCALSTRPDIDSVVCAGDL